MLGWQSGNSPPKPVATWVVPGMSRANRHVQTWALPAYQGDMDSNVPKCSDMEKGLLSAMWPRCDLEERWKRNNFGFQCFVTWTSWASKPFYPNHMWLHARIHVTVCHVPAALVSFVVSGRDVTRKDYPTLLLWWPAELVYSTEPKYLKVVGTWALKEGLFLKMTQNQHCKPWRSSRAVGVGGSSPLFTDCPYYSLVSIKGWGGEEGISWGKSAQIRKLMPLNAEVVQL